ncbi:hypothetical protein AKO1_014926 [Acrasis kona]|uniref:Uncharacterized protein n=1 Tax=Acrasis kona TaxID=1008807 RepID=A0AAW2Z195_9EUKA
MLLPIVLVLHGLIEGSMIIPYTTDISKTFPFYASSSAAYQSWIRIFLLATFSQGVSSILVAFFAPRRYLRILSLPYALYNAFAVADFVYNGRTDRRALYLIVHSVMLGLFILSYLTYNSSKSSEFNYQGSTMLTVAQIINLMFELPSGLIFYFIGSESQFSDLKNQNADLQECMRFQYIAMFTHGLMAIVFLLYRRSIPGKVIALAPFIYHAMICFDMYMYNTTAGRIPGLLVHSVSLVSFIIGLLQK